MHSNLLFNAQVTQRVGKPIATVMRVGNAHYFIALHKMMSKLLHEQLIDCQDSPMQTQAARLGHFMSHRLSG